MNSHIAIVDKNNRPLVLNPDTSITITEKNPMFNDVEMFSQPFQVPFENNRHLVKNLEDLNSSTRAADMEGERFRIFLDGLPSRTTVLKIGEDTVLDDSIDVNLDASNRTFKDMIADLRCRDVKVDNDILIGEKIGDVTIDMAYRTVWTVNFKVWNEYKNQAAGHETTREVSGSTKIYGFPVEMAKENVFQPPALGFSYPGRCVTESDGINARARQGSPLTIDGYNLVLPEVAESYINTVQPYPYAKYCNSRVCYAHHAKEGDSENEYKTSDALVPNREEPSQDGYDFGPYWVLPADRPASGICFYVTYFLERLFKALGVAFDMTALTNIEDFNYLCFFSTSCKFTTVNTSQKFVNVDQINEWLSSRGCGGQLNIDLNKPQENRVVYGKPDGNKENFPNYIYLKKDEYESCEKIITIRQTHPSKEETYRINLVNADGSIGPLMPGFKPSYENSEVDCEVRAIGKSAEIYRSGDVTACVQKMYATSDNFPDANVSEIIESLENSFGVRFCYDAETNKVTVRLLRDMFRDARSPVKLNGIVTSMRKKTEKITGIKMGYSAEADSREQQDNVRYQKKDYDTTYNYVEYPQGRTQIKPYADILKLIDIGNMNCYVDMATGNAYRVKVNSEAKAAGEMKPSLFEVGALKGVSLGDCSKENEDFIREFRSSFEPIITNNLKLDSSGNVRLVPFVDEDMEHEFLKATIQNVLAVGWGEMYVNYVLNLAENFDPSKTDDGQSPLMSHDWGLTVGILRPGIGSEKFYEYDYNYDGFGNSRWGVKSDDYAVTADTFDCLGKFLGVSEAGSFSLKPAAYKPFRYYYDLDNQLHISTDPKEWNDMKWLTPCANDVRSADGKIVSRILSRGMCDSFMTEFFRFLLDRQRYEVKALCATAELIDIPNKWLRRWEIAGKVGYINSIEYSVGIENGVSEVTIDFFSM